MEEKLPDLLGSRVVSRLAELFASIRARGRV
jgi:hypothetical protein